MALQEMYYGAKKPPLNLSKDGSEILVAPRGGFEPPTYRLTAGCSTVELPGNPTRKLLECCLQIRRRAPVLYEVFPPKSTVTPAACFGSAYGRLCDFYHSDKPPTTSGTEAASYCGITVPRQLADLTYCLSGTMLVAGVGQITIGAAG